MAQNPTQRPSLGQFADLGALYDARSDSFLSKSLLRGPAPETAVSTTRLQTGNIQLLDNDSYRARLSSMKVSTELGASFLSGMLNVSGAAEYLRDTRSSNFIEQASVQHVITTVEERLSIATPELRPYLCLDSVFGSGATHVVAAIVWGGQSIATFKHQLHQESERDKVKQQIHGEIERIQRTTMSGFSVTPGYHDSHSDRSMALDIVVCSDMIAEVGRTTDLKTASDFILDLPNRVAAINGAKGLPLTFTLFPLEMLSFMLGLNIQADAAFHQPSSSCLENFVGFFDELRDSGQKINDYYQELARHKHCIPPQFLDTVASCGQSLAMAASNLTMNYGRLLKDVRCGRVDQSQLIQLLETARREVASSRDISDMTSQYHDKVTFVSHVMACDINYLGYGADPIEVELQKHDIQEAYVLYYTEKIRLQSKSWDENYKLLLQLLRSGTSDCTVVLIDCDATGAHLEHDRISRFQGGRLVVPDVLEQITHGKCYARYIKEDQLDKGDAKKPLRRSAIKIACPSPNCDKNVTHDWICAKCEVPIEYGAVDQHIYCDCGRSPCSNYGFKCKDLEHGKLFERYEKGVLLQLLNSLDPLDELNILIIGETGVGKSTFINAFMNYLTFNTLDEAMEEENLNWVIPCSFNVQSMDRSDPNGAIMQRKIKVGDDEDEVDGATGSSATQKTVVYPITQGDTVIRLIDTPGIGDTRGVEMDKANMANILAMLSNFDKLHGILFLLKSNSSRLTFMFRFVVEELLTHLHRDAALNMVFGFTNTRISNYMPGDTFGPLTKLLERHKQVNIGLSPRTVYCFDSESFRFLAAQKDGVTMDNIQDFRLSWEKSEGETKRLIEHFRSLSPHFVRSTLSLNQTRDLIMHLTRPMADIMQEIDTTIQLNVDNIKDLEDTKLRGDRLRDRLHWEKTELESRTLNKPRTVCNDTSCKEFQDDGSGNLLPIYKSMCHEECYLTGVPPEVLACAELMKCAAFNRKEDCEVCGHHWENHIHIVREQAPVLKSVEDESVKELLAKNANDMELKKAAIENLKTKIKEADFEYKEIQDGAVKFGLFLKKNSITPYNDAMLAYLDHLIKEETDKVQIANADRERLDNLLRHRREHVQQVEVLSKNMDSGSTEELLDEGGVEALVEHLYRLKHWGKNLRDIKNKAEEAHLDSYRERPYRPHQSRSSSNSFANSTAASAVNWLAGRIGTGMTITTKPARAISTRAPATSQSKPTSMPGGFPVSAAKKASIQVQKAAPQKLQAPRPPPSKASMISISEYEVPPPPVKQDSLKSKLLRPFSKRF